MIYLHIGKSKTGTTTIQLGLETNRDLLLRNQYLYPQTGIISSGHHNLYFELSNDPRFDKSKGTMDDLFQEINEFKKRYPNGNVILSCEGLEALLEDSVWDPVSGGIFGRFLALVSRIDEVGVIYILRRQDKYYQSFWSMDVRLFKTKWSLDEYVMDKLKNELRINEKFRFPVERLEHFSEIKSIKVLSFDSLVKGGLLNQFLNSCNINSNLFGALEYPPVANSSPSPLALELIRQINQKYGKRMSQKAKLMALRTIRTVSSRNGWSAIGPNKSELLSKETYSLLIDTFQAGNNWVSNRYSNLESELQFDQNYEEQEILDLNILSGEDIIDLVRFGILVGQGA